MPDQEAIANQLELLAAHRRTLAQYLKQQALISELFTPPAIAHGIEEARANIARVKNTLREWGVPFEDLPDDEEPATQAHPPAARQTSRSRAWTRRRVVAGILILIALISTAVAGVLVIRNRSAQTRKVLTDPQWTTCGLPAAVLPGFITPAQDPTKALEQIGQAIKQKQLPTWPVIGPDVGKNSIYQGGQERNPRYLYLYVKSGIENQTDIMLSNKVHVSVSVQSMPGHVDVIVFPPPDGCGLGLFRTFPPVALKETAQEYSDDRVYPDQDFLTVEPHKFEILRIPLECQSPGVYTIQLLIRYQDVYQFLSDTSTAAAPAAVCPQSFTLWPVTFVKEGLQFGVVKNFVWNGTSYQEGE